MAIIQTEGVTKSFVVRERSGFLRRRARTVTAVEALDMTIEAGELVGYIGPNGAGKSTTVKMLTGILTPTTGRIQVAGLDPSRQRVEVARRVGVVFGQRTQLWWDLPLADSFELLRRIYRIPPGTYDRMLAQMTELLELGPLLTTPVRQLSLGQRMRGDVAAAFLHEPDIVYLDEPTIGLDVVSKDRVRRFLSNINRERSVTILLTTHDMADIEHLCSRVMVIDRGSVIHDGSLASLRDLHGTFRTVVVDLETQAPALTVPDAEVVKIEGPRQWLRFDREVTSAPRVIADIATRAAIVDLSIEDTGIEEVVQRIYTSDRQDEPSRVAGHRGQ